MGYGMSAARLPEVGYRGAFGHSLGDVQGLHHSRAQVHAIESKRKVELPAPRDGAALKIF